jgi:hypothetical protein
MKRNYFIAIAVAALMIGTTVAQAADVSFSGQFRPRFQINEDFSNTTTARNNFTTRARLNAKANVNANTEVFLQFQSVGTWGFAYAGQGTRVSEGDATSANDKLNDVGLHQAYVTLKGFMGQPVDVKIGRQQVVFDGHRLFGHTGWTDGGNSMDAIRLNHNGGNHTLNYVYIAGVEAESTTTNTDANVNFHVFRANTQGIMGGDLTGMFVVVDDNGDSSATLDDKNTWYTIGARQKGKVSGLDYRVEYYHQFGEGGAPASGAGFKTAYTTTPIANSDIDRDASMFGIRLGKTFKEAKFSPTFTLWFDSLSGTSDDDVAGNDWGTFDTHMDTGHKFYGLMDLFLGQSGGKTGYYGLEDFAIKTKFKVSDKNTLKMDWHHFRTQTDLSGSDADSMVAADAKIGAQDGDRGDLGTEVDLTLVHKYDANTKIVAGYSHYFSTQTLAALRNSGNNDDSNWMYVMVDTKF